MDGISVAIDSGAWDKLTDDQRLAEFRHVIVWRTPGELIVARLWSSRDGKGRTKYPMVLCAHCRGVPVSAALGCVLPALERLEGRCRATEEREEVVAALDEARRDLRARLVPAEPPGPELVVSRRVVAELADDPSLGPDRQGYHRVVYQIEREMESFLPGADAGDRAESRSHQLRVPAGPGSPGERAMRWLNFLLAQLSPLTPIMLVVPIDGDWLDAVVGDPTGAQLFCIRASPKAIPLTSEIPYTLEPELVARADRLVEACRNADGDELLRIEQIGAAGGRKSLSQLSDKMAEIRRRTILRAAMVVLIGAGLIGLVALGIRLASGPAPPASPGEASASSGGPSSAGGQGGAGAHRPVATNPGDDSPGAKPNDPQQSGVDLGPWRALCAAYDDWFGDFAAHLSEPAPWSAGQTRAEALAADAQWAPVIAAIRLSKDPWNIAQSTGSVESMAISAPAPVRSPEGVEATRRALGAVEAAAALLRGEWSAISDLGTASDRIEGAGLSAAPEALRTVVERLSPARGGDAIGALDEAMAMRGPAAEASAALARVSSVAGSIGAVEDPVLAAWPAWVASELAAADGSDAAALVRIAATASAVGQTGERLAAAITEHWAVVDPQLFASESAAHAAFGESGPSAAVYGDWLFQVADPRFRALDPEEDPRGGWAVEPMRERLKAIRSGLSGRFDDDAGSTEASDLFARADRLASLPWNRAHEDEIRAGVPSLLSSFRDLEAQLAGRLAQREAIAAQTAEEAKAALLSRDTVVGNSDAINAAWRIWRNAIAESALDPAQMQARADGAEAVLRHIADRVPEAGRPPSAVPWYVALWEDAAARREAAIAELLSAYPDSAPSVEDGAFGAALARAIADVESTGSEVKARASRLDAIAAAIGDARLLDEPLEGGDSLARLTADARPDRPTAPDLFDRVAAIEQIAGSDDRASLIEIASHPTPDRPEAAIAAYRRLGLLASPPWPATAAELGSDADLRSPVERALRQLARPDRRDEIIEEFGAERRRRWTGFARGAASADDVIAAAALMSAFDVTGAEVSALDDVTGWNVRCASFVADLDALGVDDAAAQARIAAFLESAGAPPSAVASLATDLAAIAADEPPAVPPIDVTTLGPGSVGWRGEAAGDTVTFSPPEPVAGAPEGALALGFIRVEPGDSGIAEPVYMLRTELSVAQLAALAGTQAGGELLVATMPAANRRTDGGGEPGADGRRGPRTWQWDEDSPSPAIRPARTWLSQLASLRVDDATAPGLDAGAPTWTHPAQHLPPGASVAVAYLAGCRLPTSTELLAARGAAVGAAPTNLRDSTWNRQLEHTRSLVSAGKRAAWPDEGAFWPKGFADRTEGPDATPGTGDDEYLWFAPAVGSADQTGFVHLVGNVAEYALDDPAIWAAMEDVTPASIAQFVRDHAALWRVVGGSAIGAPEIPSDRGLPLDLWRSREGYADVGVRLVFSARGAAPPRVPIAARARAAMADRWFIAP